MPNKFCFGDFPNVDSLATIDDSQFFMAVILDFKMAIFFFNKLLFFVQIIIGRCKIAFYIIFVLYEV